MPTKEELQQRLDQISELFASIVTHADHQSSWRCPYKNRFDQCTAQFGCRNKRKPRSRENSRSASATTNWTIARHGSDPATPEE